MSKIVRYDGDVKAFAADALTNERTVFGGTSTAADLTSQLTSQYLRGWGTVGANEKPTLQDFNAVGYTPVSYTHLTLPTID
jgi:hypothetical protein